MSLTPRVLDTIVGVAGRPGRAIELCNLAERILDALDTHSALKGADLYLLTVSEAIDDRDAFWLVLGLLCADELVTCVGGYRSDVDVRLQHFGKATR